MEIILTLSALAAIIAGIVIILWPKIINYAIGLWLLLYGLLQILPQYIN